MNTVLLVLLLAILAYDLYLVLTNRRTISARYQAMFPTWFDLFALVLILPGLVYINLWPALKVVLAVVAGHLLWPNSERWK